MAIEAVYRNSIGVEAGEQRTLNSNLARTAATQRCCRSAKNKIKKNNIVKISSGQR